MIKISSLKLPLDYDDKELEKMVVKKLKISDNEINNINIIRRSIDARKKDNIYFVISVEVVTKCDEHELLKKLKDKNISEVKIKSIEIIKKVPPKKRPIVVGFGPAGMFCALELAKKGYNPIVIERGKNIDERTSDVNEFWSTASLNTESNVQFGEGGAGTFSDGKLNTGTKSIWSRNILKEFVLNGASKEILYDAKPHIGTDKLKIVVKNIRKKIISFGGEIRFQNKLVDIIVKNDEICKAVIMDTNKKEKYEIDTDNLILALGHSARDTFEMLYKNGIYMEAKPFSIGARIEHPQILINKSQFGKYYKNPRITPADYKLFAHLKNGRGVYSFCMCPGGTVVPATNEKGCVVTNGMSEYKRNKDNANSALLVSVSPDDYPDDNALSGIVYQRQIERMTFQLAGSNYKAPVQRLEDFLNNVSSKKIGEVTPSYSIGYEMTNLNNCLPKYIVESMREGIKIFDKKLKGFRYADAILTGSETRSSSPVRISRNENMNSINCKGIYPCGEGCGYAGGIMSAAVDGIKVASQI